MYASVPPILHLTASDSNPFYFNFLVTIAQITIVSLFLLYSKSTYVNERLNADQRKHLLKPSLHCTYVQRIRHTAKDGDSTVVLKQFEYKNALGSIRLPIAWALVSSLHYGFLAWAVTILETAIATTIFELWPVFLVYTLARHEDNDKLLRGVVASVGEARRSLSKERVILTAIAGFGLVFMLGSQAGGGIYSISGLVSYEAVIGMVIVLVAAFLAALSVLSNLAYGKVLYYAIVATPFTKLSDAYENPEPTPIELRGDLDRRLLVWLTLLGYVLSRLFSLPVNVAIGFVMQHSQGSLSSRAVLGALVIGGAAAVGGMMLRVGNIRSEDVAVNSLLCLGPAISLSALMVLGISLPRFDLFVVGAVAILTVNVLIHLRPQLRLRRRLDSPLASPPND